MSKSEKIIINKPGGRERIEIGITEYKGKEYLDIRNFYRDAESGEYKPSPKGVSVPVEMSKKLSRAVRKVGEPYFDLVPEEPKEKKAKTKKAKEDQNEIEPVSKKKKGKKIAIEDDDDDREPLTEIDDEDRPEPQKRKTDFPARSDKKKTKKKKA